MVGCGGVEEVESVGGMLECECWGRGWGLVV